MAVTLPYMKHKEVSADFAQNLSERDFYGTDVGPETRGVYRYGTGRAFEPAGS